MQQRVSALATDCEVFNLTFSSFQPHFQFSLGPVPRDAGPRVTPSEAAFFLLLSLRRHASNHLESLYHRVSTIFLYAEYLFNPNSDGESWKLTVQIFYSSLMQFRHINFYLSIVSIIDIENCKVKLILVIGDVDKIETILVDSQIYNFLLGVIQSSDNWSMTSL